MRERRQQMQWSMTPMATAETGNDMLSSRTALILLLLVTAAVLSPMLAIGFVNDDLAVITFAFRGGHPDPGVIFSSQGIAGVYYRPLVDLSFAVDYWIWGWNPLGFRLTNLLLHLVNVYLVYRLSRRLLDSSRVALLAAALFGVLPIHETSLLWIPGRTDILCCIFYLASLLLFAKHLASRQPKPMAGSLLLFLLALFTKETAFSLPLVAGLIVWWHSTSHSARVSLKRLLFSSLCFGAVAFAVVALRWLLLGNNLTGDQGLHGNAAPLNIVKNIATYIGLLVIPFGHYQIEGMLSGHPKLFMLLALLALAAGLFLLWRFRGTTRPFLLCALWIGITLLPVSRLMMRWYLYIPSVGFCMGVGWLLSRLGTERRAVAIAAVVWLLYVTIGVGQSMQWRDASGIAGRLLRQLDTEATVRSNRDTLTFITLPAKVGTTPIFHLGFPVTLRHHFQRDSMMSRTWAGVVMDRIPAEVHWQAIDGAIRLDISGGYFFLADNELMMKRKSPEQEMAIRSDGATITILSLNEQGKPNALGVRPDAPVTRNLFLFDGEKFIRVK
jgi:hypothetical protein